MLPRTMASLVFAVLAVSPAAHAQFQLPEIKIEPPKIELPKVELPKVQLPTVELPPGIPNPVDPLGLGKKAVEEGSKALGVDGETAAVIGTVVSPGSLINEEERKSLPPDIQLVAARSIDAAEKVGKFTVRSVIQPYSLQADLGKKAVARESVDSAWGTVVDSWSKSAQDATAAGKSVAAATSSADNALAQRLERGAGELLGDAGRQAVRTALVTTYYADAIGVTAAETLDLIANGQDPAMLLAAPLAIELEKAYNTHIGTAKPIPDAVKAALARVFSADTLANARWTVGQVEITLPNILNRGNQVFGNEHAVTVKNLIIFSVAPGDARDWLWYWAHEIRHTDQYRELGGVRGFAWAYIRGWEALEQDARSFEARAYDTPPPHVTWDRYLLRSSSSETRPFIAECISAAANEKVIVAVERWSATPAPCSVTATVVRADDVKSEQVLLSRYSADPCIEEAHRYVSLLAKTSFACAVK